MNVDPLRAGDTGPVVQADAVNDTLLWDGSKWVTGPGPSAGGAGPPPTNPAQDGFIPRGLGGSLQWFGGAANQVVLWDGTRWAAGNVTVAVLTPGTNGQVLTTAAGAPTWALLTDTNIAAGANVAVTKLAAGTNGQVLVTAAGAPGWAQIANANVAAAAAIDGTKINPNFGAQTITSTTELDLDAAAPILRLGTTSGANQAATIGHIRVNTSFTLAGWTGTTNRNLLDWSGTNFRIGSNNLANVLMAGSTAGQMQLNGVIIAQWQPVGILINSGGLVFSGGSDQRVKPADASAGNGLDLLVRGGDTSLTGGTVTGGTLNLRGGDATGSDGATTFVGGKVQVIAGDCTGGAGTRTGGNVLIKGGGVGGAGPFGNLALQTDPASFNSMQKGLFVGDCNAQPTAAPAAGVYLYVVSGGLLRMDSAGNVTTL